MPNVLRRQNIELQKKIPDFKNMTEDGKEDVEEEPFIKMTF